MFDFLLQLNEAAQDRHPVFKATLLIPNSTYPKVLDVQHIPLNDMYQYINRLIKPILSQFKEKLIFQFNTEESGVFNILRVSARTSLGLLNFEFTQLTNSEVDNMKKIFYTL